MTNHPAPIILALDLPTQEHALQWVRLLREEIPIFKIGMQLFYRYGPDIAKRIRDEGVELFLDLKLHDIPHTVARACESLLELQARFLTIHISGGKRMLQAALEVTSHSATQLIGVTALTSLDQEEFDALYPDTRQTPSEWGIHLAEVAQEVGLPGIVCSAQENRLIRSSLGNRLCLINPGIRPQGSDLQDQKRAVTPVEAIQAGADYLVIGRPILQAGKPKEMVREMIESIDYAIGLSP